MRKTYNLVILTGLFVGAGAFAQDGFTCDQGSTFNAAQGLCLYTPARSVPHTIHAALKVVNQENKKSCLIRSLRVFKGKAKFLANGQLDRYIIKGYRPVDLSAAGGLEGLRNILARLHTTKPVCAAANTAPETKRRYKITGSEHEFDAWGDVRVTGNSSCSNSAKQKLFTPGYDPHFVIASVISNGAATPRKAFTSRSSKDGEGAETGDLQAVYDLVDANCGFIATGPEEPDA